jgi:hypothetical protein
MSPDATRGLHYYLFSTCVLIRLIVREVVDLELKLRLMVIPNTSLTTPRPVRY